MKAMFMDQAFVKLLETNSPTDIALLRSVLEGAGIRFYLQGENQRLMRPFEPVSLMVAQEDAPAAEKLLHPLDLMLVWLPFANREPHRPDK